MFEDGMEEKKVNTWGGARTPGPGKKLGPKPKPKNELRIMCNTRIDPRTKELAIEIGKRLGLRGYGQAIDVAIEKLAKELGIKSDHK